MIGSDKLKKIVHFISSTDGSLKKKVIRSGIWVGISRVGINLLSFVRTIILARLLNPDDFGLMGICLIVHRGIEIFTQTGFAAALIHRKSNFDEAKDTAFTLVVIRGIILAAVVFGIAPFVANYYEENILVRLLRVFALVFIINGFGNINIIALHKELNFKLVTFNVQARRISELLITVTLAYYLRSVWALVLGNVISAFASIIISYRIIPGRIKFVFNKKIAGELFGYGKFITGLAIVVFVSSEIANAVIGKLLGMEELGYYVFAFTLASLPTTHISKIISRVMFPAYSKLQDDREALKKTYLNVLKIVGILAIPASLGIAVLAPEIVRVVYGERWLPVAGPLPILCIYGCLMAIESMNGYVFNAIGKPNITFYIPTGRLPLTLIIIYPFIIHYGINGAAMAVTIPLAIQFFVSMFIFSRVIELRLANIARNIMPTIAYSCIMAAIVYCCKYYFLTSENLLNLVLLIIIGVLSYSVFMFKEIAYILKRQLLPELK